MVFGGVPRDEFQLNEDTLWSGGPYQPVNHEALTKLEEVRALALRSAEAARQTAELIEQSVSRANRGADITRQVEARMAEIDKHVAGVHESVGNIVTASDGQRQGVSEVNVAMQQMNQVTQSVAASAEESSSASEELAGQSQMLAGLVGEFKLVTEPSRRRKVA